MKKVKFKVGDKLYKSDLNYSPFYYEEYIIAEIRQHRAVNGKLKNFYYYKTNNGNWSWTDGNLNRGEYTNLKTLLKDRISDIKTNIKCLENGIKNSQDYINKYAISIIELKNKYKSLLK